MLSRRYGLMTARIRFCSILQMNRHVKKLISSIEACSQCYNCSAYTDVDKAEQEEKIADSD